MTPINVEARTRLTREQLERRLQTFHYSHVTDARWLMEWARAAADEIEFLRGECDRWSRAFTEEPSDQHISKQEGGD